MHQAAKTGFNKPASSDSFFSGATETHVKQPKPSGPESVPDSLLRMQVKNLNFYYGKVHALHNINLDVAANRVTALIGPSGCGKSTCAVCAILAALS